MLLIILNLCTKKPRFGYKIFLKLKTTEWLDYNITSIIRVILKPVIKVEQFSMLKLLSKFFLHLVPRTLRFLNWISARLEILSWSSNFKVKCKSFRLHSGDTFWIVMQGMHCKKMGKTWAQNLTSLYTQSLLSSQFCTYFVNCWPFLL